MSFKDEVKAIESRLLANWATTPIRFEGVPFTEPSSAYVALTVLTGEGVQISLGDVALRRWPGVIVIQIFVPELSGTRQAKTYADSLGAIFDRAQFSSDNSGVISCRTPSVETIGMLEGWWQVNVLIPYRRSRQY